MNLLSPRFRSFHSNPTVIAPFRDAISPALLGLSVVLVCAAGHPRWLAAQTDEPTSPTENSNEIVLDNGDAGTSFEGTWKASGGAAPHGGSSLYARNDASYTFTFQLPATGTFEVHAWWTEYSSRSTSVPIEIRHLGGTSIVTVNQQVNGGRWNDLGGFSFGTTATIRILAVGSATTCADAIRVSWEAPANAPPSAHIDSINPAVASEGQTVSFAGGGTDPDGSITGYSWSSSLDGHLSTLASFWTSSLSCGSHTISLRVRDDSNVWSEELRQELEVQTSGQLHALVLDNGESGTSRTGAWSVSGGPNPYGRDSLYAKSAASYTYSLQVESPGAHDVYACWTTWPSRSTRVPITIQHGLGTSTLFANQQVTRADFSTGSGPSPTVSVRSWGARGDGVSDDTAAILGALDSLPAQGGVLLFPAGEYIVSSSIRAAKPVTILGTPGASVIRAGGAALGVILDLQRGADGSVVEGITFHGSKSTAAYPVQTGIYVSGARDCLVRFCTFSGPAPLTGLNFGIELHGDRCAARVIFCRFERLVSSGSNGTAILFSDSSHNEIVGCYIDGTELNQAGGSAGAAIMFAPAIGGTGSSDNYVGHCVILNHPQAGIAFNSTTYAEFQGNLASADRNTIERNEIVGCVNRRGGEASSGITLVGSSSRNRIRFNWIHANGHSTEGGYGIVLTGTKGRAIPITMASNTIPILITAPGHGLETGDRVGVSGVLGNTSANGLWTITVIHQDGFWLLGSAGNGDYATGGLVGLAGTPKIDELGRENEIIGNRIHDNQDHGVRINGPTRTLIRGNEFKDNGQRTGNVFANLHVVRVSPTGPTGNDSVIEKNSFYGTKVRCQIEIGSGPANTVVVNNLVTPGMSEEILDAGTDTVLVENRLPNTYGGGGILDPMDLAGPQSLGTGVAGAGDLARHVGQWSYMGTYSFGSTAFIKVNAAGTGTTCADAFCLMTSVTP